MSARYVDRIGRPITDPGAIEARRIQQQMRRLISLGTRKGRKYDEAATVGELASATKLTVDRVIEVIREYDAWLWGLTENGERSDWFVWEDGE